ncbi:mechanosensitive ion channel family protein [Myxococcota bacterium]|nr:mechanosensitive ion channel family protein [Myxococcota bacterium]
MNRLEQIWAQLSGAWLKTGATIPLDATIEAVLLLAISFWLRVQIANLLVAILGWVVRSQRHKLISEILEAMRSPLQFLVLAAAVSGAAAVMGLYGDWAEYAGRILRSLIFVFIFWTIVRLVEPCVDLLLSRYSHRLSQSTLRDFVSTAVRTVLFLLGLSTVLELWGVNVVGLLGSLGLLGAAVALGAKEFFADLLAGIVLLTNRIADRGDWIRTTDVDGNVEAIGLRATRVRKFDKTLITVPNHLLVDYPLTNFTRMTQRRIYWTIGLEYRTSESQLKTIVREISDFIHQHEEFETDPAKVLTFVFVDSFGDSSINIMVYCFTRTTVWREWLALKEELAYEVKRIVESHGAGFAFPSTSLYVESLPFGTPEPFPADGGGEGNPSSAPGGNSTPEMA